MGLEKAFTQVSSEIEYVPIPRSHALVPEISHSSRPGFYSLVLMDNPDAASFHKIRVIRQFLAKTAMESLTMAYGLECRGRISAGSFTWEVAETKKFQIAEDGRLLGYVFPMALQRG